MSKATVLRCDTCEAWDSQDNPVRTVGVAGPRFDLCSRCRVRKIIDMGVTPLNASAYVEVFNERTNTAGSHLSLPAALKQWQEKYPDAAASAPDSETDDDESDELEEKTSLENAVGDSADVASVVDLVTEDTVDSPNGDHEAVTVFAGQEGTAETGKRPSRRTRAQ